MEWVKPGTKIDFIRTMPYAAIVSGLLVLGSWLSIWWPGIRWGIDFSGGTEIHLRLDPKVHIDQLRQAVEELKLGGTQVQGFEAGALGGATNEFLIRVAAPKSETSSEGEEQASHNAELVNKQLLEKFGAAAFEILENNYVGPRVGKDLRMKGIYATLYTLIGMLLYVSFRFEFRYGLGAIFSLFHDGSIVLGALIISRREFDLSSIAAIMTILGYSINDTIVIFDRIREGSKRLRRLPFREMMNTALNETLSRTLLTSLTVFFTVFCLWLLGGGVIRDFSFAMMVGVVFGTFSSIYIATAFVVWLEIMRAKQRTATPLKPDGKMP
jgi:preprotein translocase subunit SecF